MTIADTGAKNGCSCPNTSVAITHATPAATPAWSTERQATRSRSKRACIETRERSAASSIPVVSPMEGSSGVVGVFRLPTSPVASSSTWMSVKVPPISIPIRTRLAT